MNNHSIRTFSLKITFIENSLQHIHDQFVVASVDRANRNVAFNSNEMLIKYCNAKY